MLPPVFQAYFSGQSTLADGEDALVAKILASVDTDFSTKKYVLGLVIDFCLLCQSLSKHDTTLMTFDPARTDGWLFEKFERKTHSGTKELNSLTISAGNATFGIRKFEENVKEYFHSDGFMSYPSAYVYNTGQWAKFTNYLNDCVRLGSAGREILIVRLIAYAKSKLKQSSVSALQPITTLTLRRIVTEYPMAAAGENAGLTFQALCYGFCSVLYSHLNLAAASVRTGSRRQGRLGDIDAYQGDKLAVTCEVKDLAITEANQDKQISQFYGECKDLGITAIVYCQSVEAAVEKSMPEVRFMTIPKMVAISAFWDQVSYAKFFSGVLFYLFQIECNESARQRFEKFLADNMP